MSYDAGMPLILLALSLFFPQTQPPASSTLDTAAIEKALARTGQMQDGVYKVAAPRSDLKVTVNGIAIRPGLALGSWMAFKRVGADTIAHGDLVLLEREINPVISALQQGGMDITAVHNHVVGATPVIMYVHFWGRGTETKLASTLKAVLAQTATPVPAPQTGPGDPLPAAEAIQAALGRTGSVKNGVLGVTVARPETITMMGAELPPSMGMATSMNFQATDDGRVAATGDFVMIADEVNRVARALREHSIEITALHSHMIHGSPELYFMHFWTVGTPQSVGAGLKAALAQMATK